MKSSFRRRGHWPWMTLLLALLALAISGSPAAESALSDDRASVLRGEFWRLWTGHWVHFGASHLWWNLAVFVPAGAWSEFISSRRTRWLLALAPGIIGAALLSLEPSLLRYGGLSGLATAVLTLLALTKLGSAHADRWVWLSVLALIAFKITAEFLAGQPLFARFADPMDHPVPLAHLAGAICALAAHFIRRTRQI